MMDSAPGPEHLLGRLRCSSGGRLRSLLGPLSHRMKRTPQILESAAKSIAQTQPRHRSVLVVESDPDLQWQLARMLTVAGNRVVGTGSGEGALTVVEHWQAELALVAEHLPTMSGFDLAKRLRQTNPNVVVILMADREEAEHPTRTTSADITASLTKPFRFDALRALIDSLQLGPAPAE